MQCHRSRHVWAKLVHCFSKHSTFFVFRTVTLLWFVRLRVLSSHCSKVKSKTEEFRCPNVYRLWAAGSGWVQQNCLTVRGAKPRKVQCFILFVVASFLSLLVAATIYTTSTFYSELELWFVNTTNVWVLRGRFFRFTFVWR